MENDHISVISTDSLKLWIAAFIDILNSWQMRQYFRECDLSSFREYFKRYKNYFDQNKTKIYTEIYASVFHKIHDIIWSQKDSNGNKNAYLSLLEYLVCNFIYFRSIFEGPLVSVYLFPSLCGTS